jgi:hypothetical protein
LSRRVAGLVLLAAAASTWLFAGRPALAQRDRARAEYARAREERLSQRARVHSLERRAEAPRTIGPEGAREMRLALLGATRDLGVRSVGIEAAGTARETIRGRLSAVGRMTEVLAVAERLARPDACLTLQRLDLTPTGPEREADIRLNVEVSGGCRS